MPSSGKQLHLTGVGRDEIYLENSFPSKTGTTSTRINGFPLLVNEILKKNLIKANFLQVTPTSLSQPSKFHQLRPLLPKEVNVLN